MTQHIGQTRIKLAEKLTMMFGCQFYPEHIWKQYPVYIRYTGCCRWGAVSYFDGDPNRSIIKTVVSWDTMSDSVKYQLGVVGNVHQTRDIEVSIP